jgi:hypothetical protein
MANAGTPTVMPDGKWLYVADDERGRELEVVAARLDNGDLLIIHVMPTALRRRNTP